MKKNLIYILLIVIIPNCNISHNKFKNYNIPLQLLIDTVNVKNLYIKIDKSDYKLSIMFDSTVLKEYPVVFGGNPKDDKMQQGDNCTPEGTFKVLSKYPHKKWSKFIWLDYPNKDSWRKFNEAKKNNKLPANAKIGGKIGIHGVPQGADYLIDKKRNWTLGCISLKNKDINEIYPYIHKGTIVRINK